MATCGRLYPLPKSIFKGAKAMKAKLIVAIALLAGIEATPAYANLVQNGDFRDGSANWSYATENVFISTGAVATQTPASDPAGGFQTGFINGKPAWETSLDLEYGTISQTIVTKPGQTYKIEYLLDSTNIPGGFTPGTFVAIFNGIAHLPADAFTTLCSSSGCRLVPVPSDFLQNPPPALQRSSPEGGPLQFSEGIQLESFTAVATGTSTTLEFAGASFTEFLVTDVSVEAVPEPSTVRLFLPILIALWLAGRRRSFVPIASC